MSHEELPLISLDHARWSTIPTPVPSSSAENFPANYSGALGADVLWTRARVRRPCSLYSTTTMGNYWGTMIVRRYEAVRETDDDDERPASDIALVIHDRRRPHARNNPLLDGGAILQHVLLYASGEGYLFLGGVSTSWKRAWADRPKVTPQTVVGQSLSCLVWGVESGCRFGGKADWKSINRNKMSTCVLVARSGDVEALQYARRLGCKWSERACATAALEGYLGVIQWSRAHGCPWDALTCAWAARGGHLRVLRWCRTNGCPWDEMTCAGATAGGHLEVLQWCRANGCPWGSLTIAAAAGAGHLHVLEWCKANGCPRITSGEPGWDRAYRSNPCQYEFVSWLSSFPRSKLSLGDAVACAAAAQEGHLEVLQWCRANGCRWDEMTCAAAASRGHLEVLQWCRENGCPWDSRTCANAARGGHLTLLIWCRAHGCPWDEATCDGAAQKGHLEVLRWCRANGCRWSKKTWDWAAMNGHLNVLQWCAANGFPRRNICFFACKNLDVLRWLHANNLAKVDNTITACWSAAFWGNLEVLQWLRTEGCPWAEAVCSAAAVCGHLEVLKWSTANGCPWDAGRCAESAASGQQLHVIRWLEAERLPFVARFSTLRRFVMLDMQGHLRICGFEPGACSISVFFLAGMLGGTVGFTIFFAVGILAVFLLSQFHRPISGLGRSEGHMVMVFVFTMWSFFMSPIWFRAPVMFLGGGVYACDGLQTRALRR